MAPQPDNGSNPRPDNRAGWLEGETPDVVAAHVAAAAPALEVTLWDPVHAAALPQEVLRATPTRRQPEPRARVGRLDRSHMLDLQERLDELKGLGLYRRMRMVSGPQGPRVVLDGRARPAAVLQQLPRPRRPSAGARGGRRRRHALGRGRRRVAARVGQHDAALRRLEERLAEFKGTQRALLFGSGYLANLGVVPALARKGEIVFSDALNHASIIDGCRLAGAETFIYRHADAEHLAWGLRQSDGRAALIVTDGVFSMDGDVAPLEEIVELARRHDVRVMVDEAHGTGAIGPGGRGAVADAGLEGEVDVIVGTLGKALGSYGAYVACDHLMARYLVNSARPLIFSTAPAAVRRGRGHGRARAAAGAAAADRPAPRQRRRAARRARARGLRRGGLDDADRAR